jgi:hypothetical protein
MMKKNVNITNMGKNAQYVPLFSQAVYVLLTWLTVIFSAINDKKCYTYM